MVDRRDRAVRYTIRDVPKCVDEELRKRAEQQGRSLNAVVIDVLCTGLRAAPAEGPYTDLDPLIGTWVEDPEFDRALRAQDQVDESLWG